MVNLTKFQIKLKEFVKGEKEMEIDYLIVEQWKLQQVQVIEYDYTGDIFMLGTILATVIQDEEPFFNFMRIKMHLNLIFSIYFRVVQCCTFNAIS